MFFRTVATSSAILVALAVTGAVAGPAWEPEPVTDHLEPATVSTAIGGTSADGGEPGDHEVRESAVTIPLADGLEVAGLLREPVGADGQAGAEDRPGIVFVHGAGTGKAADAFTLAATALASAGITTLVPDKRLDNYSTRHRDYEAMARDYAHSVSYLRGVPGVDPDAVGLYAESEGAWVSPVMMVDDPRLAFQVLVSAPVVPPRQQAAYAVDNYLRNTDVPAGVFRAIPRAVGMKVPGGGFEYADFDVRPWLREQEDPILAVYGTNDASMPLEQGTRELVEAADDVTVRFYDRANHGINVETPDGLLLHPDFAADVAGWLLGLPATASAPPQVAGAQPEQLYLAAPVPQPHWYGDGDWLVGVVITAGGLLVVGPLLVGGAVLTGRLARRRSGRPGARLAPGLRAPLAGLGVGAAATTVALVAYLAVVARLALEYEKDAVVVQGGWLGVRLLGVVTVVAAALLLDRIRDLRGRVVLVPGTDPGVRATAVVSTGFWLTVLGATALLVTLAYWGAYQLGI
ncbi:Alpha/beta hydrolase family protein [Promicromonospora umidemergens]|uniref:Alpha/beta hydrolase n=1 Tax=Promicromonospora umidemergens TaxID=629679 RepID=A0ABP8X7Y8_9MICO|nr:alpha/beta hydrolase [Promicromonospora umidemergens]MCP2281341.1 Alpha/beta hydrolase family protein [Promicromonospora umidemergens]